MNDFGSKMRPQSIQNGDQETPGDTEHVTQDSNLARSFQKKNLRQKGAAAVFRAACSIRRSTLQVLVAACKILYTLMSFQSILYLKMGPASAADLKIIITIIIIIIIYIYIERERSSTRCFFGVVLVPSNRNASGQTTIEQRF